MSTKIRVHLRGTLIGPETRRECGVEAIETSIGDPSIPPAYSDFDFSEAMDGLKDGDYELRAGGEVIKLRRRNGQFLSRM